MHVQREFVDMKIGEMVIQMKGFAAQIKDLRSGMVGQMFGMPHGIDLLRSVSSTIPDFYPKDKKIPVFDQILQFYEHIIL